MSDPAPGCDITMDPCMDDTQVIQVLPNVRKNLLDEFATPMKVANAGPSIAPGQEHMKVFLRVRPFTGKEVTLGENQNCMIINDDHIMSANAPKESHTYKNSMHGCGKQTHRFTFSKIFGQDTSQKQFFDESVLGTVKDFIDGQNCLVFTYGVTNSGKTYTIQGNPKDGGILPRALDVLFNSIEGKQWNGVTLKPKMFSDVTQLSPGQADSEGQAKEELLKMATDEEPDMSSLLGDSDISQATVNSTMSQDSLIQDSAPSGGEGTDERASMELDAEDVGHMFAEAENRVRDEAAIDVESQGQIKFSVWVTFAEVYNEQLYDLLVPIPKKKNARRPTLQLREDKHGVPYIKGLKQVQVNTADEAYKVLTIGKKNLQVACTKLNHQSSRSHCIFTIKVLRVVAKDRPHVARTSMLSFCDLAGAERYAKTQSTGDRIKEAGNINTSLLSLGRCIKILRHNQLHKDHPQIVPFRDSKLTRIFQSFFCGKGKASMIVNVNQCASMFDETLHALKYSAVAKQVIIVQEPKPKPKASRLVSLALEQPDLRASIAWATPGTYAKILEEEEAAQAGENDLDSTTTNNVDDLLEVVTKLKDELVEEKRKQVLLEVQIREEVCQEMAQQLVEIENQYCERLREERAAAEDLAEERIELLTQSVKKSRKRRRMEDKEEDMIPGALYKAEKLKTKEQDKRVSELEDQVGSLQNKLQELQATLGQLTRDKNTVTQENTKLQFQVANFNMKKDQDKSQNDTGADISQTELIERLSQQLQDAKEQIQLKTIEAIDLKEMLDEAGDTFMQKEQEIQKLQQMIEEYEEKLQQQTSSLEELQGIMSQSKTAVEATEDRLKAKQDVIDQLQQELNSYKGMNLPNRSCSTAASLHRTPASSFHHNRSSSSAYSSGMDISSTMHTSDVGQQFQQPDNAPTCTLAYAAIPKTPASSASRPSWLKRTLASRFGSAKKAASTNAIVDNSGSDDSSFLSNWNKDTPNFKAKYKRSVKKEKKTPNTKATQESFSTPLPCVVHSFTAEAPSMSFSQFLPLASSSRLPSVSQGELTRPSDPYPIEPSPIVCLTRDRYSSLQRADEITPIEAPQVQCSTPFRKGLASLLNRSRKTSKVPAVSVKTEKAGTATMPNSACGSGLVAKHTKASLLRMKASPKKPGSKVSKSGRESKAPVLKEVGRVLRETLGGKKKRVSTGLARRRSGYTTRSRSKLRK